MTHHYGDSDDNRLGLNLDGCPSIEAYEAAQGDRRPKQPPLLSSAPVPVSPESESSLARMLPEHDERLANEMRHAVREVLSSSSRPVAERGKILLDAAAALEEEGRRLATGDWDAKLVEQAEAVAETLDKFYLEVVAFVGLLNTIGVDVDLGAPRISQHPKTGNWVAELDKYREAMSLIQKRVQERCPDAVSRVAALAHRKTEGS